MFPFASSIRSRQSRKYQEWRKRSYRYKCPLGHSSSCRQLLSKDSSIARQDCHFFLPSTQILNSTCTEDFSSTYFRSKHWRQILLSCDLLLAVETWQSVLNLNPNEIKEIQSWVLRHPGSQSLANTLVLLLPHLPLSPLYGCLSAILGSIRISTSCLVPPKYIILWQWKSSHVPPLTKSQCSPWQHRKPWSKASTIAFSTVIESVV